MPTNTVPEGVGSVPDPWSSFFGSTGQVYRRVDIYESDGTTPFALDVPVVEGSVTFDASRDERRSFDLTIDNESGLFTSDPNGFWYDKVIKIFRGVRDGDSTQSYQVVEGVIDTITNPNFPAITRVSGRDYVKKMMLSKYKQTTGYAIGSTLESVITGIANAAGITRRNIPTTGVALTRDFFFEVGKTRWEAAKEIATAYGYELFFDPTGVLTMRLFVDPTTAPIAFTFLTGAEEGNIASFEKSTNDTRVFNVVVVYGQATNTGTPVVATATNTEPSSPTRVARLGERVYPYEAKYLTSQTDAQNLANSLLKIMGLESYDLKIDALVAPWLDGGVAVEFLDPNPAPGQPTRFLLQSGTIPLGLSTMNISAGRVTVAK